MLSPSSTLDIGRRPWAVWRVSSPCRLHRDSYGASVGAWCGISPPRSSGGMGVVSRAARPPFNSHGSASGYVSQWFGASRRPQNNIRHRTMKPATASAAPITAVRSQRDTQGDHPPWQPVLQMRRSGRPSQGRVRPARRSSDNTFTHSLWKPQRALKSRSPTEANVGLLTYGGKSWVRMHRPGVKILHPSIGSFKPNPDLTTHSSLRPPLLQGSPARA
jgi:hypothetical protein